MIPLLSKYILRTEAATAVEYGLIVAGIALGLVVAIFFLGDTIMDLFYDDLPGLVSTP